MTQLWGKSKHRNAKPKHLNDMLLRFFYLIFSLLSYLLLSYHKTHVYHDDTEPFPHFSCAALYMLHPLLCLTFYMLIPSSGKKKITK